MLVPAGGHRAASEIVAIGGHHGTTVATRGPADPEPKGGSEAAVRVAKADLVPIEASLLEDDDSWTELVAACEGRSWPPSTGGSIW